jgi:YesN/AraC family two-component response regulator
MAQDLIPDLILSDWMMPEMDGLELLKMVRQRRDTQHIPFVLLTAKSSLENRLSGLETGAEAFLAKPFHPQELLGQIEAQLAARERMRTRFREEMLHPDKVETISMEDQFLADLKRVMEAHLADDQFGVETLADALAMSRRTLTRKLSALSGQPAVKFIRNYRLERSLQMLKENTAPVWEIALKTGFGSASYFTKCFKEHYGISPKEAIQ